MGNQEEMLFVIQDLVIKYKSLSEVAKMLADELLDVYKKHGVYWEEPGERSPALIAYRALIGEK